MTGELQEEVWEELKAVRKRGLGRIGKETPTPRLDVAATKNPTYKPNVSRAVAIVLLLEYEIERLHISKYEIWLPVLFGLTDETDNTDPTACRKAAAEKAGDSVTNFSRPDIGQEALGLKRLAEQIVAAYFHRDDSQDSVETRHHQPGPAPSVQTLGQSLHGMHIRRPDLEAETMGHLDNPDTYVIYLHGDAGTGKTRLAEECANKYASGERVPVINATDDEQLREHLKALLVASGHKATDLNAYNIEPHSVDLFKSDGWPRIVVFDNVTDMSRLAFLPAESKTKCLLTGIDQPPPGYSHAQVRVSNMSDDETQAMILDRWSACPEDDIPALATALDNRPLAIEHACSYLDDTGDSVESFLIGMREHAAELVHKIGYPHERTLTAIYRMMLERVARDEGALWVLDILLHTYPDRVHFDELAMIFTDVLETRDHNPPGLRRPFANPMLDWPGVAEWDSWGYAACPQSRISVVRASLRILERLSLVEVIDDTVIMHGLTWDILRDLRSESQWSVLDRIREVALVVIAMDRWEPGIPLSVVALRWFDYIRVCILPRNYSYEELKRDLDKASEDVTVRMVTLCAVFFRAGKQLGADIDEPFRAVQVWYVTCATRFLSSPNGASSELVDACAGLGLEMMDQINRIADGPSRPGDNPWHLYHGMVKGYSGLGRMIQLTPYWQVLARYDVDWDPAHHNVTESELEKERARVFASPAWIGSTKDVLVSATHAMNAGLYFMHQAKWKDAVAALEHAFSSFFKMAGHPDWSHNAAESARRLAQTCLRMGRYEDAWGWLGRAQYAAFVRTGFDFKFDPDPNGFVEASPFLVTDASWELRLTLTAFEIDFTQNINRSTDDLLTSVFYNERAHVHGALLWNGWAQVVRKGENRMRASWLFDMARLRSVVANAAVLPTRVIGEAILSALTEAAQSAQEPRGRLHHDFLLVNRHICSIPHVIGFLQKADFDIARYDRLIAEEGNDPGFSLAAEARQVYAMAKRFGDMHNLPYWEVKALLHAVLLGSLAGIEQQWLNEVGAKFIDRARKIGRLDLVERWNQFAQNTSEMPLWMLGY